VFVFRHSRRTSTDFPTKLAVLTVLAGEVEEKVDFARRVGRSGIVVVEAGVVRHNDDHVLF
jgi:hypothetical protein